jgi:hypothetical protein
MTPGIFYSESGMMARADITVDIPGLMISHDDHWILPREGSDFVGAKGGVRIVIDGPEVSTGILGHDGDLRIIDGGFDIRSIIPFTLGRLSILLEVGGNRDVKVPLMEFRRGRLKRRFILKPPVQELKSQPEVPTTRVVRQQPVRKARNKRPGKPNGRR